MVSSAAYAGPWHELYQLAKPVKSVRHRYWYGLQCLGNLGPGSALYACLRRTEDGARGLEGTRSGFGTFSPLQTMDSIATTGAQRCTTLGRRRRWKLLAEYETMVLRTHS